jgi:hypothetical protein
LHLQIQTRFHNRPALKQQSDADYFLAGSAFLSAGLLSLFVASFLASALAGAGALAAGLASSFFAGAAGACAKADTANNDNTKVAIDFILNPF